MSLRCDGEKYGFKPDINDCESALQHQLVGRAPAHFARRGVPSSEKVIPLPYRLMGDEALCYLEPVLLNGAEIGSASLSQLRDAASDLVLKCASSVEQGGIVTNIGGDENLALTLGTYNPDVECRGSFPQWKSCRHILVQMPVSTETLVFGPMAYPGAEVQLPLNIVTDDGKCIARVWYTKKEVDTASWFRLWEAVTAVYAVCVRNGQRGTIRGLGDHGNLFLTMTPQVGPLGNISLDDTSYLGEDPRISDS